MEMKFAQVVNKGMQRDYAMNTASQEFAYENKNIRITTTGDESFLAITNEKSTIPIKLQARGLPYRDESREEEIKVEILEGHKLCFINVKQPTEIIVYFTRVIYYPDSSTKLEQGIPHKVLVTPGIEEVDEYGNKILVTYTDITGNFNELLNVEGADEVHILPSFYFATLSGYVPIGKNAASYSDFFNNAVIYGSTTCGEYLVLFTNVSASDLIFRAKIDYFTAQENTIYCELVYSGELDFNYNMEFTTYYESDDVQKVYWVDGKNQPRVINICKLHQTSYTTNLDFVPKIEGDIKVSVEKQYEGTGVFPSGVIQYYITYYNKFGQESNAVHVTPLYNISPSDRGGNEEETQTCSFKIHIENVDVKYDNIRIYSFIRTSLDTTPTVSIVGDLSINKENPNQYYEIVDDNYGNINIAPSDILFLGGNTITASTIEQKDNTLFLGNISSIANNDDYTELKELLETNRVLGGEDGLSFVSRPIKDKLAINEDYGYAPNMDTSSKDRGFKYLEWYRFGLQFQSDTGEWGSTLWLNDKQNPLRPNIVEYDENEDIIIQEMYDKADNFHSLAAVKFKPTDDIKNIISTYNSKYYRLVMAEHNDLSRTIKTQGIVMPTVFNLKQRHDNTVFGAPAWSVGMLYGKEHYQNVDNNDPWYDTKNSGWFITNQPMQQLSSAIYSLNPSYPDALPEGGSINDILNEYAVSSKILPSASYNKTIENSHNKFLAYLKVRVRVTKGEPDTLSLAGENFRGSPHGDGVLQDIFDVTITPYVKIYGEDTYIEYANYTIREYRLLGKRKKAYEYLFSLVSTKTWNDYKEYTNQNISNIDYIDMYAPMLYLHELPNVEDFHDAAKQKNYSTTYKVYRNGSPNKSDSTIEEFANNYFIDANMCNMWSPNIDRIENNNAKFRIVGNLNIENTQSDYDIVVQNNVIDGKTYRQYEANFNRYRYNNVNTGISSYPLWLSSNNNLFWVYLWNQKDVGSATESSLFTLKNKTFANLWKCNTSFLETSDILQYGNIDCKKYSENTIYNFGKLYEGKYQNVLFPKNKRPIYLSDGNNTLVNTTDFITIDKLINENSNIASINSTSRTNSSINIKYSSTPHLVFNLGITNGFVNVLPNYKMSKKDYQGRLDIINNTPYPTNIINVDYKLYGVFQRGELNDAIVQNNITNFEATITNASSNGKQYKYFSTDFGNFSVNFEDYEGRFKIPDNNLFVENMKIVLNNVILDVISVSGPEYKQHVQFKATILTDCTIKGYDGTLWHIYDDHFSSQEGDTNIMLTGYTDSVNNKEAKIFLGEFYTNYDPSTFMGGNTENALELNTFIPISDPTPIGDIIYGFEGDTYYQQWDCLRIYPTSEDDVNKVVDVVSVMLETHENLDGDTRKARGRADVINIRPDNMVNQINPIYSQSNNYVTSKILDEKFEDSTHPLQYWWSLTKVPNSDIDTWTGVNLTSVAELDGDKGPLNKIKRWNNQLYAFQDKAIAMINFNNQTTIATQEGLPVEISNSGKVNGHYYITTNNGCKNKWSIVESPNGLYFIDNYNTSISVIGDGIKSLSQLNLFQDWIEQVEKDPYRKANHIVFKGFYDPIHKEIYYADGIDCICYNELLQQFTSFYDYQTMRNMFAINGHVYAITSKNKIYKMFEGDDYCKLFDTQCDYYMQYKINNEPFIDKTWTNLEYRADIFKRGNIHSNELVTDDILSGETFDSLKVWNEYQNGELDLTKVRFNYLKDAKSKFRIWRTNLPRAKSTLYTNKFGLDRIRNPWIMLELKKTGDTSNRMEFHDLIIKYVI
jgi:hypothetical protein